MENEPSPVEKRRLRQKKYWNNRTEEQKEKDKVRHTEYFLNRTEGQKEKENSEEAKENRRARQRKSYHKKKTENAPPFLFL